jgi:hypothetical protein
MGGFFNCCLDSKGVGMTMPSQAGKNFQQKITERRCPVV